MPPFTSIVLPGPCQQSSQIAPVLSSSAGNSSLHRIAWRSMKPGQEKYAMQIYANLHNPFWNKWSKLIQHHNRRPHFLLLVRPGHFRGKRPTDWQSEIHVKNGARLRALMRAYAYDCVIICVILFIVMYWYCVIIINYWIVLMFFSDSPTFGLTIGGRDLKRLVRIVSTVGAQAVNKSRRGT
jgi:hypothetical protein